MKCLKHTERESVRYCKECGAPICGECNANFNGKCIDCAKKEVKQTRQNALDSIAHGIIGGSFGIILIVFGYSVMEFSGTLPQQILAYFMLIIGCFGLPYGWMALNQLTSRLFLIFPIVGLLIYFLAKFCLSFLIGWAVAIPHVISAIRLYKSSSTYSKFIKTIE